MLRPVRRLLQPNCITQINYNFVTVNVANVRRRNFLRNLVHDKYYVLANSSELSGIKLSCSSRKRLCGREGLKNPLNIFRSLHSCRLLYWWTTTTLFKSSFLAHFLGRKDRCDMDSFRREIWECKIPGMNKKAQLTQREARDSLGI